MKKVSTREGMFLIYPKRNQALLYIALAITCMMILGLSLPDLQFLTGLPFPGSDTSPANNPAIVSESGYVNSSFPWILQIVWVMGVILIFFLSITALYKKVNYKLISLLAGVLAILFALFSILSELSPNQLETVPFDTSLPEQQLLEFQVAPIGDPPASLFFSVKVGLVLAGIIFVGWLVTRVFRRGQKDNILAAEAESAIQAITNGVNLGGVIIRCYLNMEKVISEERGIDRDQSMTPYEFKTYLINKGIPKMPIQVLTTLFEKARYGNQCLTEQDELDALSSLSAIQKVCQLVMEKDR